jgi:uncharacterized membrane protein YbhN (UPF0104 family)
VGLSILKHMHNLSDREFCARFLENPCCPALLRRGVIYKLVALTQESLIATTPPRCPQLRGLFHGDRLHHRAAEGGEVSDRRQTHASRVEASEAARQESRRAVTQVLYTRGHASDQRYAHAEQFRRANRGCKACAPISAGSCAVSRKTRSDAALRPIFILLVERAHNTAATTCCQRSFEVSPEGALPGLLFVFSERQWLFGVTLAGRGQAAMNRKPLSRILALGMLTAIGFYLWWYRGELTSLVLASPFHLVLCAFSTAGNLAAIGLQTYAMVNKLGTRLGIWECLSLSVVSTGVNTLVPGQGGMVGRAVYLKRRHDFDYSRSLATVLVCHVLMVIVCSVFAVVAVAWMAFIAHRPGLDAMLAAAIFCLVISLFACFLPRISAKGNWLLEGVTTLSDSWYKLRAQPMFLATLTILVGLQVASELLSLWAACAAIGIELGIVEATAIGTFGTLASILKITPGAVGIYEAVVAFVGSVVAIVPAAQIVIASLVTRAVLLVLLLILTPFAISFLQRQTWVREPDQ